MDSIVKRCIKCNNIKLLEEFTKDKRRPSGYGSSCKSCNNARGREWTKNNPDYLKQYNKTPTRREKDRVRNKIRNKNPEFLKKKNEWNRLWTKTEKGKAFVLAKQRRRMENPIYMFKARISARLRAVLSELGLSKKDRKTSELLGFSKQDLYNHLIGFLGKKCEWCGEILSDLSEASIDHIVPIHTATTEEEVIKLNHLSNLRLLHFDCNLQKGGKLPIKR